MDTINTQLSNIITNLINSRENIQQTLAVKMIKESMIKQEELTKKLLEGVEKVTPKNNNSTFEYKV